jgi:hypothetical protein
LLFCYAEEASDADSIQTNTSRDELPDGVPMAQAASEPTVFPRHAAQLSLHEARDLLNKDHYGLDKVASWSLIDFHLTCVLVINPLKKHCLLLHCCMSECQHSAHFLSTTEQLSWVLFCERQHYVKDQGSWLFEYFVQHSFWAR